MDIERIKTLLAAHAWIPLIAILIGLVVRLLKSDTKIPIDIPPRLRTPLLYVLAATAIVLEKVATGASWESAIIDGVLGALLAQQGHLLVIDSVRGGKELNLPGLIIPGAAPGPDKPVTIPPGPPNVPPGVGMIAMGFLLVLLSGCGLFFKALDLAADKAKCVVENQDLPDKVIFVKCAIENPEAYLDLISEARASTRKALERQAAARRLECAPTRVDDAGAPADGAVK